jgi:DNA-binding CsgD family transcriptional regulator
MAESIDVVAAIDRLTMLVAAVATKGMKQGEAAVLLSRGQLTNNQIAAVLDTSPDSVRAQLNQFRRAQAAKKGTTSSVESEPEQ